MMRTALVAALGVAAAAQAPPHLSQAWQANSIGDGSPDFGTGLESYIYEACGHPHEPPTSETCMHAHVWDYGANNCVKYEVDAGLDSLYTGTFYVACDAVDCCKGGDAGDEQPDIKRWDIGQGSKLPNDQITSLGQMDTKDLDGPVTTDTWNEIFKLPLTTVHINYTYYITTQGNDAITHRIDYSEPGDAKAQNGHILYGNFTVQHDLDTFRNVFKAPAACLKPNTLTCASKKVKEWERKYFSHSKVYRN